MTDRTLRTLDDLAGLTYDDRGLVPVVAQDAGDGRVLMVAWATPEALERSLEGGEMTFWSRSRGGLWRKGETSGNVLRVVSLHADCDGDTVLARVRPSGPACHTGEASCFGAGSGPDTAPGARANAAGSTEEADGGGDRAVAATGVPPAEGVLPALWSTLRDRAASRPEGSYTTRLLEDPNLRVKKLGEETAELIQALVLEDGDRAAEEAADLIYHTLVALLAANRSLDDVLAVLEARR
ncbi:MAG TPA: bifunctional phosphoribosyl-AMP cyclohydrolase/phosphoribosyl-ATP diphosphatase HisIE [Longimicrobiales bacterium]|nr:bifunctional phosphoribosyl-AMP cyclohydrolase/phosphoribosyl-ATP diphosphatase HisIE [Longimicrobiales bacterium]